MPVEEPSTASIADLVQCSKAGILSGARREFVAGYLKGRERRDQLFSSRFSSLKKRQSVPCAMIVLGLDLIMPTSRSRSE